MPFYDYSKKRPKAENVQVQNTSLRPDRSNSPSNNRFYQTSPTQSQPVTTKFVVTPQDKPITTTRYVVAPQQTVVQPPMVSSIQPTTTTVLTNRSDQEVKLYAVDNLERVDRDKKKIQVQVMNKEMKKDVKVIRKKKASPLDEGFKSYYDEEADVLGVMCCLCCAERWNRCDNVFKSCRNVVSCPVYCWLLFIIPFFVALIICIIITMLVGGRVIN